MFFSLLSCHEKNVGANEYCTMCLTKKRTLHNTREYRPDQFVGSMDKLHLIFEGIEKLKQRYPPTASIEGSMAPDFIQSSHGIRYCSCDYFILEQFRKFNVIPARRAEIVAEKRRCVVDIAENGNLAGGVFLFNRLISCVCRPDKREILKNFDDVISALPKLLSEQKYNNNNHNNTSAMNLSENMIDICSVCHQNLSHFVEKNIKYKPKMKVLKPRKKRPNSAEKRERIEKYRAAVKLVTTGRGASHNVHNVFSTLRLGVTRTPYWLKKNKR